MTNLFPSEHEKGDEIGASRAESSSSSESESDSDGDISDDDRPSKSKHRKLSKRRIVFQKTSGFGSFDEVENYLLQNKDVLDKIVEKRNSLEVEASGSGKGNQSNCNNKSKIEQIMQCSTNWCWC